MHHPAHKSLKAAYSFYNIHTETPLLDLMSDALIIAKLVSDSLLSVLCVSPNLCPGIWNRLLAFLLHGCNWFEVFVTVDHSSKEEFWLEFLLKFQRLFASLILLQLNQKDILCKLETLNPHRRMHKIHKSRNIGKDMIPWSRERTCLCCDASWATGTFFELNSEFLNERNFILKIKEFSIKKKGI